MNINTEKRTRKIECYNCGNKIKETHALEYDGELYCLDCWLQEGNNGMLIDYGYKPTPIFCKMSYEKQPLFMGIELEVEAGHDHDSDYNEYDEDADEYDEEHTSGYLADYAYDIMEKYPCYIKYDGSLDSGGMEIVTHPYTNKYHKQIFNWKELLKKLSHDGFTSHDNNRCGLHIHLSKNFFKKEDYLKFNIFFDKNYSIMKRFSKRTKDNYCHKIEKHQTEQIRQKKKKTRLNQWYDHYKSIYFGNAYTIEIRIFRGTLNVKHFYNVLDLTEALAYFVKSYSLTFFIKASKKLLWYTFLSFMKQSKQYDKVLKDLETRKLTYCNLKNIPRTGKATQDSIEAKDLTTIMGNEEVRHYLKDRQLKKLRYYFDTFEDYTINSTDEVYHIGNNYFVPMHFEKIVMYNKDYNAKTRKMLIKFFLSFGYIVEMVDGETTLNIRNRESLARKLNIDIDKINREKDRKEHILIEHSRKTQDADFLYRNLGLPTDLYSIQQKCAEWKDNKIEKLITQKLAKRENRNLTFIFRLNN